MKTYVAIAVALISLAGCASKPPLVQQELYQKYPAVADLRDRLESEKDNELAILSPQNYRKAEESYSDSVKLAKADNPKATGRAKQGLVQLGEAKKTATLSGDVFEEVLTARTKAIESNASQASPITFAKAENRLLGLTAKLEAGQVDAAKAGRADATRAYTAIELESIKVNVVDSAKAVLLKARKADIDDYAPKTMRLAEEKYQLALNTLNADREDVATANMHAQLAIWNTQRATQIAETITHFRESDFQEEDKILWFQEQISRIVEPVEKRVAFDSPNKNMVKQLTARLSTLVDVKNTSNAAMSEARVREKEREMASNAAREQSESLNRRNQEITAKFKLVQSLFSRNEAEVYRQADDVLIRAYGFAFRPGNSDIDARNYGLLNKISKAIDQFPDSQVIVSGHTDNRGSDAINLNLSVARGKSVAKFLTEVRGIEHSRTTATGYGKNRPIAGNETGEGRAANRRVEVLIVNKEGLL